MTAYYNEFDKGAAAWLRELIRRDLIAPGDVDERSIEDVRPDDLRGYTQHHFFAGIGGWSYALRLAGWPDDQPVWTGSCPCQPFSSAGARAGFDDQRHLWPAFFHLIRECRPSVVFGEQVASKAADAWIDLVHADLEGVGYAFGDVPFPSAGIGAPNIRDRNYWLAYAAERGQPRPGLLGFASDSTACSDRKVDRAFDVGGRGGLADSDGGHSRAEREQCGGEQRQQQEDSGARRLADPELERIRGEGFGTVGSAPRGVQGAHGQRERVWADAGAGGAIVAARHASPLHGFWRNADWLLCRDGKWRPVEPGTFPLAHGLPARMVRLRGYGNAINPHQAAEFIAAAVEAMSGAASESEAA